MASGNRTSRRTYPLSALFVLMVVCGVIAALLAPLFRAHAAGEVSLHTIISTAIAGIAFSVILGVFIGLFHHRRDVGVLCGSLTGVILGPLIGPLVLIPAEEFPSLLAVTAGGSLILIVVGAALRLGSKS